MKQAAEKPVPAAAASSDSTNNGEAKSKTGIKFDPNPIYEKADVPLTTANGDGDSTVQADVRGVVAAKSELSLRATAVFAATIAYYLAKGAWAPFEAAMRLAVLPIGLEFSRVIPGASSTYRSLRVKGDWWLTGVAIQEHVNRNNLGLKAELVGPLNAAIQNGKPARASFDAAVTAKKKAEDEYMVSKRKLEIAIQLLKRSIARSKRAKVDPTVRPKRKKKASKKAAAKPKADEKK